MESGVRLKREIIPPLELKTTPSRELRITACSIINKDMVKPPHIPFKRTDLQVSKENEACNGEPKVCKPIEKDGHYFLAVMEKETSLLTRFCQQAENDLDETKLPEEAVGKIRTAVGQARLLMSKKFKQFRSLCELNMKDEVCDGEIKPKSTDLEGFWDLVLIQVDTIHNMFAKLDELKKNGWVEKDSVADHKRLTRTPSKSKTGGKGKGTPSQKEDKENKERGGEDKARFEARRRLAEAKRRGRRDLARTNSIGEVEIYLPKKE